MSEVIVSVLDFIIKSNVQNPVEMVLMFTIIGYALYYFVKIKPDKDKKISMQPKDEMLLKNVVSAKHIALTMNYIMILLNKVNCLKVYKTC